MRRVRTIISLISLLATVGSVMPGAAHADVLQAIFNFATAAQATQVEAASISATPFNSINTNKIVLKPSLNIDPSPSLGDTSTIIADAALVPSSGPGGEVSSDQPSSSAISLYVVRNGDTLSSVAKLFGVSVNTIRWANNLSRTSSIKPGQSLVILPVSGVQYVTKKGDTLASIAKKFGGDAADIASFNSIDVGTLTPGTTLMIPNGESDSGQSALPATGISIGTNAITKIIQTGISKSSSSRYRISTSKTEPAHNLGHEGSAAEVAYYTSPLVHYVKTQDIHGYNGVDMGAPAGTSVMAAAAGTVIVARDSGYNGGYGNYIVISHDNGSQTLYAHLSRVSVSQGASVEQGQVIGTVGQTGWATGPHLHFEIRNSIMNPF
ncbi:MAG: peptidase family protein [Candidatus Kaiserbacteria bacterium]|nr:peptidase family protein [Candidatus Kaiserbacteria bacterium]